MRRRVQRRRELGWLRRTCWLERRFRRRMRRLERGLLGAGRAEPWQRLLLMRKMVTQGEKPRASGNYIF